MARDLGLCSPKRMLLSVLRVYCLFGCLSICYTVCLSSTSVCFQCLSACLQCLLSVSVCLSSVSAFSVCLPVFSVCLQCLSAFSVCLSSVSVFLPTLKCLSFATTTNHTCESSLRAVRSKLTRGQCSSSSFQISINVALSGRQQNA